MADLCQILFGQTGHFHDGTAFDTILQHGTGLHACLHYVLFQYLDTLPEAFPRSLTSLHDPLVFTA